MSRMWVLIALGLCTGVAWAQNTRTPSPGDESNYVPAVPASSSTNAYGWYPGYNTGGGTAAGSALNGMANVISAQGDYNLATSAAAVNMTQAQRNEIQNRQQWTNTYFDMRETNRQARAAERGKAPTMEQIARMAHDGVPKPLGPTQMDPVTGKLKWPNALLQEDYSSPRQSLDQLFATWVRYGGLSYADQTKVRQATETMFGQLKSQIRNLPPQEYVTCRNFLQSLTYAATQTELD